MHDLAVGGDDFERGDGGGEITVLNSGAVGCGRASAHRRDVGKGSEVVEGVSLLVDVGREGAVSDSCSNGDSLRLRVEHHGIEMGERDLGRSAVGDGVEGVAATEGAEFGCDLDHLLSFFDCLGSEQVVGVVGEVAGPVGAGASGLAGGEAPGKEGCWSGMRRRFSRILSYSLDLTSSNRQIMAICYRTSLFSMLPKS